MTRRAAFKKDDVKRAVSGCMAAGLTIGTVSISPSGEIVIYPAGAESAAPGIAAPNPLDRLL